MFVGLQNYNIIAKNQLYGSALPYIKTETAVVKRFRTIFGDAVQL